MQSQVKSSLCTSSSSGSLEEDQISPRQEAGRLQSIALPKSWWSLEALILDTIHAVLEEYAGSRVGEGRLHSKVISRREMLLIH